MLGAGIQQKPRPGLDHGSKAEHLQPRRQRPPPPGKVRRERVEVMNIERQRHAVIPGIRDQVQRVIEAVIGRSVGVEREPHAVSIDSGA